VRDLAKQHRPKLIIAGGSGVPRAIDFKPFGEIARETGAALMADIAHPRDWSPPVCTDTCRIADFRDVDDAQDLGARAAAWCSARRPTRRRSTRRSCPGCRAGRSCTSSPPRPSPPRSLTPEWRA